MNPLTQSKNTKILPVLIALGLACFAFSPAARAVCQEGCLTNQNTVLGDDALLNNTGLNNTAVGFDALFSNTTGYQDTAMGAEALFYNTLGQSNTAIGFQALFSNTTAHDNTAIGSGALFRNTTGTNNTATGVLALWANRTGGQNTATGEEALENNTNGAFNTATGDGALFSNTGGNFNTAIGNLALENNRTGASNIALGFQAGLNLRNGSDNIYIGNSGGTSLESATIRIGTTDVQTATFIAGINGVIVPNGVGVIVGIDGKLGTVVSSERFKDEVKPMDKASEVILALKPVTFRYKHELDPEGIPQFGLVAEEVEKVNPDLVARDADAKAYTVRYEAVNAMLLNEFLKEHRKVEEQTRQNQQQEVTISELKSALAQQKKEIQALIVQSRR